MGDMNDEPRRNFTDKYQRDLASCFEDIAVLKIQMANITQSLNEKHTQNQRDQEKNRTDIHRIRNDMQISIDRVSVKLDGIRDALAEQQGVKDYKQWIFPALLSLGLVIIGVLDLFKK